MPLPRGGEGPRCLLRVPLRLLATAEVLGRHGGCGYGPEAVAALHQLRAARIPLALVKTGKYLPRTHRAAAGTPDHVLDSFADLPALLEQLS